MIVWRYIYSGRVKHKFVDEQADKPVCSFRPWRGAWRSEQVMLDRLPACRSCVHLATL